MRILIALALTGVVATSLHAAVDADSVVGMWLFDEGSGDTAEDASGNGNDGILVGATWEDGVRGSGVEFDGKHIINSDHALYFEQLPKSMIVLGAGAVGVEFASIYRSFGCEIEVVELLSTLIPIEDADLGQELHPNGAVSVGSRGVDGCYAS